MPSKRLASVCAVAAALLAACGAPAAGAAGGRRVVPLDASRAWLEEEEGGRAAGLLRFLRTAPSRELLQM